MCFVKDTPENHGISSSSILDFIDETERNSDVNLINFMLLHGKYILAQSCKKPYDSNDIQLLFSVTKSFTSIGIGIAADKGFLDLDAKVVSFFHYKLPENISENLSRMNIRHLLSMTTGIHDNTYSMLYPQKDWVKAFLAQDFPHEPDTYYRYSTHASHMLSAIIKKATGENLLDFLDKYLFSKLDIPKPQWETGTDGIIAGGMGLSLSPISLAKFGLLLLNKGVYSGKRIISSRYLSMATSPQAVKQDELNDTNEKYSGYQYGYHFNIGADNCYMAGGSFGQLCFISPEKNLIIIATSRGTRMETLLSLIHKHFISNVYENNGSNEEDKGRLQGKLAALKYDVPHFRKVPSGIPLHVNCCYIIDQNPNGVQKIIINNDTNNLEFKIVYNDDITSVLQFDSTHPVYGTSVFIKDIQMHLQKYISYASWANAQTLELTVIYTETPYVVAYKLTFLGNRIVFDFAMNVSLNLKNFTAEGYLMSSYPLSINQELRWDNFKL